VNVDPVSRSFLACSHKGHMEITNAAQPNFDPCSELWEPDVKSKSIVQNLNDTKELGTGALPIVG